ncbi:unnamed protein product [Zymoseptoria tritici ST99CH_1E4]|nr:unnamed protein product [Zymoseptoria tritici ST99CH_1E4]
MSYSHMAPPIPAQKPPSPYPPYNPNHAGSPTNQSPYAPPPAKRQRLSPGPMSPQNGSPAYANSPNGLPGAGSYGNPYASQAVQSPYSPASYAGSPQNSFNTPQAYHPPQQQMQWQQPQSQQRPIQTSPGPSTGSSMMPPPPRPNKEEKDEKVGVEDIGDSLFGSGINLKDEENYLHNTWNNRHGANDSFATAQSTSFGSSTLSGNNSFNMLTQGTSFGSQGQNGAMAGTLGQAQSQEQIEEETIRKRGEAARAKATREQHHLNNQFLLGNCVRNRMHLRASENAVKLDTSGVYVRNPGPMQTQVMMNGASTEGVAEVKPESMIDAGVAYDSILSLISLAAGERLRGLIDDAYGLARARRYGDHGRVVPPEFADIAMGEGEATQETVVSENVTGSQWEKTNGQPPVENGEVVANGGKEASVPVQTVSFQGSLNARLRELAEKDKRAEMERTKKREARRKEAAAAEPADGTMAAEPSQEMLAAAAATEKITKKELAKKAKEATGTGAQTLQNSNQTAAMMALGSKTKKFSWMTGGVSNMPTNRFAKQTPAASGTATPKVESAPSGASAAATPAPKVEKVPTWGDWREDEVTGKAIHLRDWICVLDRDGREKKALQKALNKLS